MRKLTEYIFESGGNGGSPKPIHLFKNEGRFYQPFIDSVMNDLGKEWEAALMDCHEDEYLFITSDSSEFTKYYDKIDLQHTNITDGVGTRGIGCNYRSWWKVKDNKVSKYPLYIVAQGVDRKTTQYVIFADKSFFE